MAARESSPLRASFVFHNPRRPLLEAMLAGREPDTALLGLNHLGDLGIDARLHDPAKREGPLGRVLWTARELPLPWQLREADVVFTPLANLFPLAARARRRPRVVVVNYGLNLIYERSGRARRRLLAASLRAADGVVCLGRAQREQLLAQTGADPARVHVVLLGADVDWFAAAEPARDGYVLTVGKDLARDLPTFVEAVGGLGVRGEIVADPRHLGALHLRQGIRARSNLPAAELRDLYAGAACVVVPQRRDGYPYGSESGGLTAICEALAAGTPIVASDRAVVRDYLDEDELVPPEDPPALREAVERVLGDPAVARERAERSRRRAEERHSTRRFAEAIAPILRNSVGSK